MIILQIEQTSSPSFTSIASAKLHILPECCSVPVLGVLHHFQHCTGHITMGSWKGGGNQYIQFIRILYCKLPTNGKQLQAFPLEAIPGNEPLPQRWEARVLLLYQRGPLLYCLRCLDTGVTFKTGKFSLLQCYL